METALRKKLAGMITESAKEQVDRFKQMLSLLRSDEIGRNFLHMDEVSPMNWSIPCFMSCSP
jgi:hypothetical protein